MNVQLSAEEMQLVRDPAWILTKHRIIEKVYGLFGHLSAQMQQYLESRAAFLPEQVLQVPPKISKGEQYESLPYVVLDYPRFFTKTDVLAIRSFFWWGNYFSINLQLKGQFQQQWCEKIALAVSNHMLQQFYYSYEGNEFSFNLEKDYLLFNGANPFPVEAAMKAPFLKISFRVSFEQWDAAEQELLKAFELLMRIAQDN